MNAYIKFGEIMSICSQDIKRKRILHKSRAITLVHMCKKIICNNPKVDLVNMNAYIKVVEVLLICSKVIVQKQNYDEMTE